MRSSLFALAVLLLCAPGCASSQSSLERDTRATRYRPGQSLAARLCACRECLAASCCSGDGERESALEGELGMALRACGRCLRRTWTVRGDDSCESHAPSECCAGSIDDPALATR